jgi:chemotaxis protein MotB
MGSPRFRKTGGEAARSMGWLTTFNDLVTLLMVFFVLLFTMGSVDTRKLSDFRHSLASGLGIMGTGDRTAIGLHPTRLPDIDPGDTYDPEIEDKKHPGMSPALIDRLAARLKILEARAGINSQLTEKGAYITFDDRLLFDVSRAKINPAGLALLDDVALLLKEVSFPIRVEGHTDNVPIHTRRFPSNWDLSIARAVNVVKHFINTSGINPERLSAVGYGESRPLVANDSPRNRSRNRRVEIVLVMEEL